MDNRGEDDLSRLCFVYLEEGFSDWSSWTDCMGLLCQMGRQQRRRACLQPSITDGKKSICNGEQIQERDCSMPCSKNNSSLPVRSFPPGTKKTTKKSGKPFHIHNRFNLGVYSNWTEWSNCRSSDCTTIRTRQCLQEPCLDALQESRACQGNLCSSKSLSMMMMTIHLIFH